VFGSCARVAWKFEIVNTRWVAESDTSAVAFPPAQGVRRSWQELPRAVRREIEGHLGSEVQRVESIPHGFSPGVGVRLFLQNGRRAFAKAASADWNRDTIRAHRQESRISAGLPPQAHAPRLMHTYDDGEWVVLVFEDVGGRPPHVPWRQPELDRVLDTLADMAAALTPSPIEIEPLVGSDSELSDLRTLHQLRSTGQDSLSDLDPWFVRHLDRLVELEMQVPAAAAGETLLHADIRADNILLTENRVWLVDWPHAGRGAAWIDLLGMLPSVAMQHGPDPERTFTNHPVAEAADPDAVTVVLAALTGLFLGDGRRPDPPGLPTVRAFQRGQGAESLKWLKQRTRWA
jgi:hypothetical protein